MNWKVRHEGSPRSVEGLTLAQIAEGLQDGQWEPTDEVMGPEDRGWIAIENHPQLAEAAADVEPPPPPTHDDETHLDMTPLIDVCMVLLIFFILTTSYAALQKFIDAPDLALDKPEGKIKQVSKEMVKDLMVQVSAKMENGSPIIRVEGEVVDPGNLVAALRRYTGGAGGKRQLLLDHDGDVRHGLVVEIMDKAKIAGMTQVHLLASPNRP